MHLGNKIIIVCLFVFMATQAWAEEPVFGHVMKTKTINCGYAIEPPYFDKDVNTGKLSGINYEIMEKIGKAIGFKINWSLETGMGDAATVLDTGKIDALCVTLWPSSPRLQTMTQTRTQFYTPVRAWVRKDDKRFDGDLEKADRKDARISAIDGDFSYDLAEEKFPHAALQSLPQTAGVSDVLLQVVTKKADVVMMDQGAVNDFNKHNGGELRKVAGVGPVRIYTEHLYLKLGEYQLRDMFDAAVEQLIDDGSIDGILKKYNAQAGSEYTTQLKNIMP